ncbi:hypothetical protein DFH08DRAFT_1034977 [Mycena albidolilacea]|uniref:NAD(P)-binding protein n=1 Tax=Mycena albidolilacea TaxID=1033008 RepID=A0AAD6ZEI4_9AGAR|nr:hypothetical protein DFH08DRAFT_1034977 [Mycena albidolilacea]
MAKLLFWGFVRSQQRKQQPAAKVDLAGKTVLVLGANTGLGFEATKHFANMNPERLILACRSQSRGQAAVDKLKAETGYRKTELWIIDLADFNSVKRFGDKFEREGGRLDILVENAALMANKYEATKDGWESSLQVSCLSVPLVALLFLPAMIKTGETYSTLPKIVVVASEMHHWVDIEKSVRENPNIIKTLGSAQYCNKSGVMMSRYMLTKLLNIFFVRGMNAVNPGYCCSELRRGINPAMRFIDHLMELCLAFTTERHPETLRGEYINACEREESSDFVIGPDGVKAEERLWDEVVDILGKVDPRVTRNVKKYLSAA